MFRKVLVGLDGSRPAEAAVPWVRSIIPKAKLTLLRVYRPGFTSSSRAIDEMGQETRRAAQAYLQGVAGGISPRPQVRVGIGPTVMEITKASDDLKADLIALTLHRHSRWQRTLGGITDELLEQHDRPLLLFPPDIGSKSPPDRVDRILVPLDGSPLSRAILPLVDPIARAHKAAVELAHIRKPGDKTCRCSLYQDLHEWSSNLRSRGIAATIVSSEGREADSLVNLANEHSSKLIAMSAHGYGFAKRFFVGSVAMKVAAKTPCPLMLAGAKALERISDKGKALARGK